MSKARVSTKSAKAAVMRPEYRPRVVRDRTKYRRNNKHSQRSVEC